MKNILFRACFIILTLITFNAAAQVEVVRSTETVILKGKKYYLHIVKKGETIYSIANAYKVSRKDIAFENPEVMEGELSLGQSLKIPITEGVNSTEDEILFGHLYNFHKVEKGQTVYSLSKKYNITVDELYKINPDAKEALKVGMILKFPKEHPDVVTHETEVTTVKTDHVVKKAVDDSTSIIGDKNLDKEGEDEFILHVVLKRETLYRLSKDFDISREILIADNPSLKDEGLKEGDTIRIRQMKILEPHDYSDSTNVDSLSLDSLALVDIMLTPCNSFDYKLNNRPFNIVVMLPFSMDESDIRKEENQKEGTVYYPKSKPFLELYEGILIAVDSMRHKGMNINLYVFDTKKDTNVVKNILKKGEIASADLIIGPAFSTNLKLAADFAKAHKISLISPFYAKHEIAINNPYVFQLKPTYNTQLDESTFYLAKFKGKNLVVVHQGDSTELAFFESYRAKLEKAYKANFPGDTLRLTMVNYRKARFAGLDKALLADEENFVIVPSTDQAFVSDLCTRLHTMMGKKKIVLFGLPAWGKFDNIELEYLHKLNMHTFSPFFVDYTRPDVQNFVENFRIAFAGEPVFYQDCNYSMCGYDIGIYFFEALMDYGKNFRFCIKEKNMLQNRFKFVRLNESSGFENKGTFIIKYDREYDLIKIDPRYCTPEEMIIGHGEENK